MNRNTNKRINQVTEDTLVIGIDIAKKLHYACALDDRGRVLKKAFPISQDLVGFEKLYAEIQTLMSQFEKPQVVVGFEPTGHYWMNLAAFLTQREIPFVMVNPMHVNRTKELDDNLQTKNDKKDARVIASLIRDGRFSYPRVPEGIDAELRNGASIRLSIQQDRAALQNQMIRWLDLYFPEFVEVFKSFGKIACAILENTPFPSDLTELGEAQLLEVFSGVPEIKTFPKKKLLLLIEKASVSVGIKEGKETARYNIYRMVKQYKVFTQDLEVLEQRLQELAAELPDYEYITSIQGLGENTAVEILSEIGPLQNYEHPRQLIKLAGLTLRENSSGQHKGQKRISKRGRKKLRSALFKIMLPLLQHNVAFKSLYEYYTSRPNNPLRNKQAMVVLCGKLLKIIHGLCTKKRTFCAENMMKDLHCLHQVA